MKNIPAVTSAIPREDVLVRFWGVRGSTPSPAPDATRYGCNTSCVELRVGSHVIILDAGTGIRRLGMELMREEPLPATLIISHTHWDHIQGLPFFGPAYSRRNRINILAPPGCRARIRRGLEHQMEPMHFPIRFGDLPGLGEIEELAPAGDRVADFSIRVMNLNHPGGCGGFRFDGCGVSICYLPDHEPYHSRTFKEPASNDAAEAEEQLIEFVRDCDLLILDTQYDEAEYPARIGWGHGCVIDSVALAGVARVKELVAFHHDPAHNDAKLEQLGRETRSLAKDFGVRVRMARESDEILLRGKRALV